MTPEQKIKATILMQAATTFNKIIIPVEITVENVDGLYQELLVDKDLHWDYESEFRSSGELTGLECDWSRHYESDAVAAQMFDGSWVGWTYWHGGGKHSEPNAIEWMNKAYFLDCVEEEKLVVIRKFSKIEEKEAGL